MLSQLSYTPIFSSPFRPSKLNNIIQRPSSYQPTIQILDLNVADLLLRKEVIHPHVLVGIPCYDFTPIICPTLNGSLLTVRPPALGITNSHGVTGGVYKTRERIHRNMLIYDY